MCIKKKVIHIQRPIVLKSIDDRVHCHWCHDPLFASFDNWIKASLLNSVMVWLLKLSHLMPGDQVPFWKIWITRCLQLLLVLLRIFQAYLTWISGYLGINLAMVRQDLQDMLHRCQLNLCWNQRWICWRCGCIKGPGQKIFLPIITKTNLDNLQWLPKLSKCNFSLSCE